MQRKNKKILLKYSLFFILFFNALRVNSQLIINASYPINSESGDILCIDIDSNGNIYVGGDNGISFFDGKTFKNTRIEKEFVWALNVINDDSMLYITLKNIILFSDNKKLILKSANNQKMPLIKKLDNEIYVLCDDSLFLYNHGKLFFKYTSNKNIIRDFCKINNQLFIIEEFRIYNYTKKVYQNDIGVFGAHSTAYNKHFIQQMDSIIEINESNGALKIIKRYTNFKQFYYDLFKLNISINDSLFFNKSTKYLFRFKEHNDKIYHLFFKNIVKQSILDIKLINNKINTNFILLDSNLVLNVITKEIYKTEKGKSVFWKKVDNKFINEIDEYSKLYKIRKKYLLINYLKPSYVLNNDFKIINVINGSEIGLYSINNINDTLFSALNNEGVFFFNEHYTYKYINSNEVFLSISKGLNNELFLLKQNGLYNFNLSDFKERLLLITNSFNKVVNINYSYICLNNNNQINIYKYGSKNYNLKLIKELVLKERIINVLEAKNNMIIICDHAIYYYHIEN
jgi:hypothetical protein